MHGGKFYLKEWILSYFPANYEEMEYVEPCGGACNVLLNKIRSKREIYNDLDKDLYNLVYCLKTQPVEMSSRALEIPYSEESFLAALQGTKEGVEGAINEMVSRRMSRGGLKKNFSWSKRKRGGLPGDENAWRSFTHDHLPRICDRLADIEVSNKHVIDLVNEHRDNTNALIYLDPPYLSTTRTAQKAYTVEMTDKEHGALADLLRNVKCKVLLSGYYSSLYAKMYKGWKMHAKEIANHAGQAKNKQRRIECLWSNF
jgi:DNA adenine methylase